MSTQILLARRSFGGCTATFKAMAEDSQHAQLTAEIPSDATMHRVGLLDARARSLSRRST